jgi:hypothetical protein
MKTQFEKSKQKILKQYPNALTKIDKKGKYYVDNGEGKRLIGKELMIPNFDTIEEAWVKTHQAIKIGEILDTNNNRFSDEKILMKTQVGVEKDEFTWNDEKLSL